MALLNETAGKREKLWIVCNPWPVSVPEKEPNVQEHRCKNVKPIETLLLDEESPVTDAGAPAFDLNPNLAGHLFLGIWVDARSYPSLFSVDRATKELGP